MPDISMCKNEECPLKMKCYRHQAIPFKFQIYTSYKFEDGKCDSFWPIGKQYKLKSMEKYEN